MEITMAKKIPHPYTQKSLIKEVHLLIKNNLDKIIYSSIIKKGDTFLILKISKDETKIMREKTIIDLCIKESIPTPNIIMQGLEKNIDGEYRFFLVEQIDGKPLTNNTLDIFDYNSIITSLAKILLKLHRIDCKGFGYLSASLIGYRDSWQQFITEGIESELLFLHKQKILSKRFIKELSYYLHFEPYINKPSLLHGHISKKVVFINQTLNISTLITDDYPISGDPHWDLAGYIVYEGFAESERLIKSYYLLGGLVEWDSEKLLKTALRRAIYSLYYKSFNKNGNIKGNKEMIIELMERLKIQI